MRGLRGRVADVLRVGGGALGVEGARGGEEVGDADVGAFRGVAEGDGAAEAGGGA